MSQSVTYKDKPNNPNSDNSGKLPDKNNKQLNLCNNMSFNWTSPELKFLAIILLYIFLRMNRMECFSSCILLLTGYTRNTHKIWRININNILRPRQAPKPQGATSDGAVIGFSFDGKFWGNVSTSKITWPIHLNKLTSLFKWLFICKAHQLRSKRRWLWH